MILYAFTMRHKVRRFPNKKLVRRPEPINRSCATGSWNEWSEKERKSQEKKEMCTCWKISTHIQYKQLSLRKIWSAAATLQVWIPRWSVTVFRRPSFSVEKKHSQTNFEHFLLFYSFTIRVVRFFSVGIWSVFLFVSSAKVLNTIFIHIHCTLIRSQLNCSKSLCLPTKSTPRPRSAHSAQASCLPAASSLDSNSLLAALAQQSSEVPSTRRLKKVRFVDRHF